MRQFKQAEKRTRRRYAPEYKQEALALAARIGVSKAAAQLDLAETQLYTEVDYNRNRRHSAIGHISPMGFEAKQVA